MCTDADANDPKQTGTTRLHEVGDGVLEKYSARIWVPECGAIGLARVMVAPVPR